MTLSEPVLHMDSVSGSLRENHPIFDRNAWGLDVAFSATLSSRPDTEDVFVVSSLTAFALWLFLGLPVLYSDQQGADMTWVPSVLIGFLGGSVMASLLTWIRAWWSRPILSAHLVRGKGCYVTTARGNPATHEAKFLRLIIQNRGRSTVHNCKGYIIKIKHTANGMDTDVQEEVLELQWSNGKPDDPRSIPPSAFFYMNVAFVDLMTGGPILWLGVSTMPNHYAHMFGTNAPAASFELVVRIVADNCSPIDRAVRFEFDPQSRDLLVQYD